MRRRVGQRDLAQVATIDAHRPVDGVVKAQQQLDQRALAGADGPTIATVSPGLIDTDTASSAL